MKKIILFLILIIFLKLSSITIIHQDHEYELKNFKQFESVEIQTFREKKSEKITENWQGIALVQILDKFQIEDYQELKFFSFDNYLIRLQKDDIFNYNPIIAIYRNGEKLPEDNLRLIVPGMRDMFWIQNLERIEIVINTDTSIPQTIFVAENILKNKPLRTNLKPFINVIGFKFYDLVVDVFPILQNEFLLIGKDGIRQKLDYETYLKDAILVFEDNDYNLKSPTMPAGMWIKNLSYIQNDERAILFIRKFESWIEIQKILDWQNLPEKMQITTDEKTVIINTHTRLKDSIWSEAIRLDW
ncbi:MAG: molybdopterin-dependent oxidoreductase [Armatimonadetes bacterium]|nr:molybdopterin-dependent oxidoreductase [Armatimonadota bacterium]